MPSIESGTHESQRLTLHLLKNAIETEPTALRGVLQKVLRLPPEEVEILAEL